MATNINFPQELNQIKPNVNGFTYEKGNSKVETAFDSGETFQKRTNRKTPDRFRCGIELTGDQLMIFEDFYDETLDEGVLNFNWIHPILSNPIQCKFIGGYTLTSLQGNYYLVQLSVEIVD